MTNLPKYANLRDGELMQYRKASDFTGRLVLILLGFCVATYAATWVL